MISTHIAHKGILVRCKESIKIIPRTTDLTMSSLHSTTVLRSTNWAITGSIIQSKSQRFNRLPNKVKNKIYHTVGTSSKIQQINGRNRAKIDTYTHTVGTVPKSNINIVERGKSIPITHNYMVELIALQYTFWIKIWSLIMELFLITKTTKCMVCFPRRSAWLHL